MVGLFWTQLLHHWNKSKKIFSPWSNVARHSFLEASCVLGRITLSHGPMHLTWPWSDFWGIVGSFGLTATGSDLGASQKITLPSTWNHHFMNTCACIRWVEFVVLVKGSGHCDDIMTIQQTCKCDEAHMPDKSDPEHDFWPDFDLTFNTAFQL